MLKNCVEEDFYELEGVAYDRLSPDSIPVFFWGAFVLSGIVTSVLALGVLGSGYPFPTPFWPIVAKVSIVLLIIQFLIALLYSKEKVAFRFQRLQSVLLSIIALKMSIEFYFAYFIFCMDDKVPDYLRTTTIILCIGGLVYLVISTIRGIRRVQKGEFRKGGKGLYNFAQSKGQISLPIIFGVTMIGGSIVKVLSDPSFRFGPLLQLYFLLLLIVTIQYAIAFAWPEFFLFTYCKFRFDSFIIPMPKRPLEDKYTAKRRKLQKKQTIPVNSHNNHKKKKQKRKKAGG